MNIIRLVVLHVLCAFAFGNINAQASYSSVLVFQLFDEKGKKVDYDTFCKEYEIANTYGKKINACDEAADQQFLVYDDDTQYFVLDLHTIGPRFSFALYRGNKIMTVFIPFAEGISSQNALKSLQFDEGDYIVDLVGTKDSIKVRRYVAPIRFVEDNNWSVQKRKFLSSEYKGQEAIYRSQPENK